MAASEALPGGRALLPSHRARAKRGATWRRRPGRRSISAPRNLLLRSMLALWLSAGGVAYGRSIAGTVHGFVVDGDGKPLPGVTLILENGALGVAARGIVSDAKGEFRFLAVPPGNGYTLQASLPSYQKVIFQDLEVLPGDTALPGITLRAALTETVKVRGEADVVRTESATTSTTITSEFLAGLPVLGRDYQDILTLAPGV